MTYLYQEAAGLRITYTKEYLTGTDRRLIDDKSKAYYYIPEKDEYHPIIEFQEMTTDGKLKTLQFGGKSMSYTLQREKDGRFLWHVNPLVFVSDGIESVGGEMTAAPYQPVESPPYKPVSQPYQRVIQDKPDATFFDKLFGMFKYEYSVGLADRGYNANSPIAVQQRVNQEIISAQERITEGIARPGDASMYTKSNADVISDKTLQVGRYIESIPEKIGNELNIAYYLALGVGTVVVLMFANNVLSSMKKEK